ncbi:sugar phosphate isomerase/epimerase family protein [Enterocloster citroniae]|uniref:sugar phosphate isomerase/epimerase family protein n=1 Tax=Enterocloster citroniae TaxID=358743 RepID=UPI00349EE18A
MAQTLLPAVHLLEIFMPYRGDEPRMIRVLQDAVTLNYYKGVELCIFFEAGNRKTVRRILEENRLHGSAFATPYIKDQKLNLMDSDPIQRKKALEFAKLLASYAADAGYTNLGMPSGDDPGYLIRGIAKNRLAESLIELATHCQKLGINLTLEPLDRYAYKKQLIGPMEETIAWFAPIHAACPNAYIHWDSAHEALGGIDLIHSIELAAPYLAQFHLCNAILDLGHPCYGDLHMDTGEPPDFETEGFLTPELGARIIRKIASYDKPSGIRDVCVSIEISGHPGDNLWLKERNSRYFLQKCFDLAGQ